MKSCVLRTYTYTQLGTDVDLKHYVTLNKKDCVKGLPHWRDEWIGKQQ